MERAGNRAVSILLATASTPARFLGRRGKQAPLDARIEAQTDCEDLRFAGMADSRKVRDLLQEPRFALHSGLPPKSPLRPSSFSPHTTTGGLQPPGIPVALEMTAGERTVLGV